MNETALVHYVVGFSKLPDDKLPGEVEGIVHLLSGLGIHRVSSRDICAWTKLIPLAELNGPESEGNLQNLDWLTPRVLAHEKIASILSKGSMFYPCRFGVLFSEHQMIIDFIASNRSTLEEYYQQTANHAEYGLKIYLHEEEALSQCRKALLHAGNSTSEYSSNYLKQRLIEKHARAKVAQSVREFLAHTDQELECISKSQCHRRISSLHQSVDKRQLIANRAILVPLSKKQELLSFIEKANKKKEYEQYIQCELTGPWPCYSFCPQLQSATASNAAA